MSIPHAYKYGKEFTLHNQVELVRGGRHFFDLLSNMIRDAKEVIHIQVYIFNKDETGRQIADALVAAAKRKVNVFVMVDGYASRQLPNTFVQWLRDAGVQFRFFEPLFRAHNFYFGRRLHHKIMTADNHCALVGGINISDDYNDLPGKNAWLDFALYVKGDTVGELVTLCEKTWNSFRPVEKATIDQVLPDSHTVEANTCAVALLRNDWVRRKNQVSSSYTRMLLNARQEIILLCSYFLPGRVMRRHLAAAAARGVAVKVITAGSSDVPIVKHAERYLYDWLLRKNIRVYEYKGILHGKMAVCDDRSMTVGSYNLNNLSTYASIELNLEIGNCKLVNESASFLRRLIETDCRKIDSNYMRNTSDWSHRLKRWTLFSLVQAALFLSTFYLRHTVAKQHT